MKERNQRAIFPIASLRWLLVFLFCSGMGHLSAQQISTRLFNARDGLPDNKVTQLLETHKSPFRWAITRNELCRFDGYRFQTVWEKMPDIDGFAENSSGEIVTWSYLNSQKISVFEPNSGRKESRSIAEIPGLKGKLVGIWAQDTMIFLTMHPETGKKLAVFRLFPGFLVQNLLQVDLHFDNAGGTLPLDFLSSFFFDEKNQAVCYSGQTIGQNNALFRYDLHTGATTKFHLTPNDSSYHTWIFSSLPDGSPIIYSTYENGLWRWNEPSKNFEKINRKPSAFVGLHCIGTDQKGAMIFQKKDRGLEDLWLLRPDGSWLDLQKPLPKLNYRTCSGADFSRQIHFCTLEGVLRVNFERPLFSNFYPPKSDILNIPNNAFRGITADRDGNVWMMGEMISLFCRRPDGSTDRIAVHEKNSGIEITTDNALNLQTDGQGKIWSAREVGTAHNLLRIDPKSGLADTFVFKNQRITTFTILKNGGVLLAASNEKQASLLLLNPETRQISNLTSAGFETLPTFTASIFLLENPEGKIWAGGKSGLSLFDISTKKWADFPGNDTTAREFPVSVIFQEKENLWVGTLGGGLRKLDLTTGRWEIFTMANGLPANKIAGILPDDAGNLWVSTYNGLSFFQPEAKLFTNFFAANGLAHNEFNRFSFFKNADGRMFFGGLSGVSFFKPSEVLASFSQGSDSLLISQISWFAPDGKTRVEQIFGFENLEKITLPADNRFCSIRLALANYLQPEANRFAWKLEGYDADWHLNGTNNDITFHYLPAGKYRLRIKAANPTGVWGKTERVVEIEVREFWYKTWWAFGLSAAVILGLFFLYYRYNVNQKLEHAETQRIKELDHLKTRLYTNITHEFRTPLTVILGMADEIETLEAAKKTSPNSPISNAVGLIRRNGKNLLRLINQLLDLSKLDSGQMKVNLVQADIIGYLQYLTESFYSMAQERKVRLTFYPETPKLLMDFDEEKIQIIVYNLLSNALKFTGEGGKVVLHATQTEQNAAPFLQLKVQDTGLGISENELPHIFDRFYQADNSSTRKGEGTGIGLTLVKELVELMGGDILVESAAGKGTTFVLLLPVQRSVGLTQSHPDTQEALSRNMPQFAPDSAQSVGVTQSHPDTTNTDKPLLLIVEDNADVVTYIVGILRKDYQIETAANGKIGIEKALELVPDIIISDVMMPEKDGYEVCETLKNDERTSHIPIILLTAKATQEDKVAGLRVGADAYLQKPFDKAELFLRLEKLVELRQRLRERYSGQLSESSTPTPPTLDDAFLQKIRQIITEKMGDTDLGILHLCRAVGLSHTQVFRKLKALTGENPTLYIRKMRLERARHLLQTSEMNVSEIAYEVGFSDPNYFSRSFHEEFGEVPSAVRK